MLLGFKTEPIQLFPKEKTVTHNVLASAAILRQQPLYVLLYLHVSLWSRIFSVAAVIYVYNFQFSKVTKHIGETFDLYKFKKGKL